MATPLVDLSDGHSFEEGFPHEFFSWLRREAPIYWHEPTERTPDGEGFWVVSRHAETMAVLCDPETYSSHTGGDRPFGGTAIKDEPGSGRVLNMMDDPRHRRVRGLVNQGFTPRMIGRLEPELRENTREILDALRARFPKIALPRKDDICYATQNRQNAVKRLTDDAEVVIVVGAPASSNSNRLVELAAKRGARAYLVETADDVEPAWLTGALRVGVTAGASAPESLVQRVVERLVELSGAEARVRAQPEVDEGIVFQLPAALR